MLKTVKWLLPLLLLTACQVASPPPEAVVVSPPPAEEKAWLAPLKARAQSLPVAQVTLRDTEILIVYPDETLFSKGSVLPLAGGAEALDPLMDLLVEVGKVGDCDMTVRATTADGAEYDARLAAKRAELLLRYLNNRGMSGTCEWTTQAGDGAPLEVVIK